MSSGQVAASSRPSTPMISRMWARARPDNWVSAIAATTRWPVLPQAKAGVGRTLAAAAATNNHDLIGQALLQIRTTSACPVQPLKDKSMTDEQLLDLARKAATKAYAPYSNFHVGCAIESTEGDVVTGANL